MKTPCFFGQLSLLAVIAFIPVLYAAPFAQKETIMVNDLFLKTKPQCIGIYVVDIPESFKNETNFAMYDDFKIESKYIYPPAFKQRIALREKELHNAINAPGNEAKDSPFIKEIIRLPNNQGVIFDKNQDGSDDAYRTLEAHVYDAHIAFIITIDILDLSADKYMDERKSYLDTEFSRELNDKPTKLAAMQSLISRLHGRLDHDIPIGRGTCIPNGFIADDRMKHDISFGFSYDNDDFQLDINTNNKLLANGDTLFGRSGEINDGLEFSYMENLKKEALVVNTIPTEAWFFRGIQPYNKNNLQVYDFLLYANEAVATKNKPLIKIEIDSQYKQTRYSEIQMIEIWDRIVGSLRYKPNVFQ